MECLKCHGIVEHREERSSEGKFKESRCVNCGWRPGRRPPSVQDVPRRQAHLKKLSESKVRAELAGKV